MDLGAFPFFYGHMSLNRSSIDKRVFFMGRRSLTVLSTIVMLEQLSRAFTVLLQFFFKSPNSFFTNEKFLKVLFSRACTVLLYLSFKSSSSFYTNRKIFSLAFLQAEGPPSTIFQQKIFIQKKTEFLDRGTLAVFYGHTSLNRSPFHIRSRLLLIEQPRAFNVEKNLYSFLQTEEL